MKLKNIFLFISTYLLKNRLIILSTYAYSLAGIIV